MPKIFQDGTLELLVALENERLNNSGNPDITVVSLLQKKAEPLLQDIYASYLKKHNQLVNSDNIPHDLKVNKKGYHQSPRYGNVYTRITPEFRDYPAAKVILPGINKSSVLAEGPTQGNFPTLLTRLKAIKVSTLIPIGAAKVDDEEKFHDYLAIAKKSDIQAFFKAVCKIDIPKDFPKTGFEFYTDPEETFHIMHMPQWADHRIPQFDAAELLALGYLFEHAENFCCHCSAGIGRSPTLIMTFLAYHHIIKVHEKSPLTHKEILKRFDEILDAVLLVKPGSGDRFQIACILPLAEAIAEQMRLAKENIKLDDAKQVMTLKAPIGHGATFEAPRKKLKASDGTASSTSEEEENEEKNSTIPLRTSYGSD